MARGTLLIIEDDSTLLLGLRDNFELTGYVVRTAGDGQEGLDAALEGRPDLIILDIMLPKLNGFEVCRRIREAQLDMPIIMLTAKGQEEDIVRGLNLGADDYVTKPFSIKELLARASAFMRRRREKEPEVFRFGDCELDLAAHKLFRAGVEVALTPKEYGLLKFFVQRIGRALTRDDIMSSVWGHGVLVTSRSVDRCINTLRGKIEPDPRWPTFIQTIRDVGYRFEIPESDRPGDDEAGRAADAVGPKGVLPAGTRLGPYEILSLLGQGGMGEVYRARDARLERDVAVKVLARRLSKEPDAFARFKRETKAVAALSHIAIPAIYDVGTDHGLTYAVMELLEGGTLRNRLEDGVIEWQAALAIGGAVAEGLAAAHAKGIVHRDVKPANIFLTSDGNIKILDFGLAQLQRSTVDKPVEDAATVTAQTLPGSVLGTANYMSPEQVRGLPIDARSDIFSLGCVLYELLTGRRPFARETAADTLAAILKDDPPPLAASGDHPWPELDRVIRHCLEKEPADRFQAARDLAFALRGLGTA
jgi:DNA-binding response OmpR family regulator/tRNA A-37 threonylcarbamoyl transferase component Bud32